MTYTHLDLKRKKEAAEHNCRTVISHSKCHVRKVGCIGEFLVTFTSLPPCVSRTEGNSHSGVLRSSPSAHCEAVGLYQAQGHPYVCHLQATYKIFAILTTLRTLDLDIFM